MANVIKRMWHISVRIGKEPRLRKMGREAQEPRIGKCYKENVSYFSKDLKGLLIREKAPPRLESKDDLL